MDTEISRALNELEAVIRQAKGPIFTDEDRGRLLRGFVQLCAAILAQDRKFIAKAKEAELIEARSNMPPPRKVSRLIDELLGDGKNE